MRLIIEARVEASDGTAGPPIVAGTVQRRDGHFTDIGLSLAEGRSLPEERRMEPRGPDPRVPIATEPSRTR